MKIFLIFTIDYTCKIYSTYVSLNRKILRSCNSSTEILRFADVQYAQPLWKLHFSSWQTNYLSHAVAERFATRARPNRSHNFQPEVAEIAFAEAYESHGHFHELVGRFSLAPTSSVGGGGADGGLGVDAAGVAGATFVIYDRRYSHSPYFREPPKRRSVPFPHFRVFEVKLRFPEVTRGVNTPCEMRSASVILLLSRDYHTVEMKLPCLSECQIELRYNTLNAPLGISLSV